MPEMQAHRGVKADASIRWDQKCAIQHRFAQAA